MGPLYGGLKGVFDTNLWVLLITGLLSSRHVIWWQKNKPCTTRQIFLEKWSKAGSTNNLPLWSLFSVQIETFCPFYGAKTMSISLIYSFTPTRPAQWFIAVWYLAKQLIGNETSFWTDALLCCIYHIVCHNMMYTIDQSCSTVLIMHRWTYHMLSCVPNDTLLLLHQNHKNFRPNHLIIKKPTLYPVIKTTPRLSSNIFLHSNLRHIWNNNRAITRQS